MKYSVSLSLHAAHHYLCYHNTRYKFKNEDRLFCLRILKLNKYKITNDNLIYVCVRVNFNIILFIEKQVLWFNFMIYLVGLQNWIKVHRKQLWSYRYACINDWINTTFTLIQFNLTESQIFYEFDNATWPKYNQYIYNYVCTISCNTFLLKLLLRTLESWRVLLEIEFTFYSKATLTTKLWSL